MKGDKVRKMQNWQVWVVASRGELHKDNRCIVEYTHVCMLLHP